MTREIAAEFPDGWSSKGNVHPLVRIGSWEDDIRNYVYEIDVADYAKRIKQKNDE